MPRQLDPVVGETLKKYGFGKDAVWDCHGVWVVYHRVLEQIAGQAGVRFDPPTIIEAKGEQKIAAVCVTGHLDNKMVWSIGEAAPANNKNAYPWAMAEKRAVDRVILKLIGIHGLVYSEEEADDFKETGAPKDPVKEVLSGITSGAPAPKKDKDAIPGQWKGPLTKTELKKKFSQIASDIALCDDLLTLNGVLAGYQGVIEQMKIDVPLWYDGERDGNGGVPLKQRIEDREALLSQPNYVQAG
ncbi:hypothetical protein UFOVP1672_54 [uncultured Caudovirales phage]|uniref:Uncharacterized protein n=1 Tax=uncultured Caudovirales phage TaxID=2100421 RepID=A0A6J5PY68_9CAUD|nr:hypothetical protein UFOVP988_76 [uncultured Caudovirales phage]CAB4211081.1 hypothetical protein UFOVP1425_76 [uncultured Caudovirales phage]CAB4223447.1 hypothetical protein UFOVP1672_54 [uncultured Caudovirales phage]